MIELKAKKATTFLQKTIGLIGKKHITPLFFETRFGIHTFFLSESIDVIILSKENVVMILKENLKPNTFFFWNPRFNRVVELPAGSISEKKIGNKTAIQLRITQ